MRPSTKGSKKEETESWDHGTQVTMKKIDISAPEAGYTPDSVQSSTRIKKSKSEKPYSDSKKRMPNRRSRVTTVGCIVSMKNRHSSLPKTIQPPYLSSPSAFTMLGVRSSKISTLSTFSSHWLRVQDHVHRGYAQIESFWWSPEQQLARWVIFLRVSGLAGRLWNPALDLTVQCAHNCKYFRPSTLHSLSFRQHQPSTFPTPA